MPLIRKESEEWFHTYLNEDVGQFQSMKQHHVHLRDPNTNLHEPLGACRRTDNPK